MASVVFPMPPEPVMSPTRPAPGALSASASSLIQMISSARPVKSSTSRGRSHRPAGRVQ